MIGSQFVYSVVGAMFAAYALLSLLDRSNGKRFGNAAFWGMFALNLIAGSWLGDLANGCIVLALAALATFGLIGRGAAATGEEARTAAGERHGNRLFLPILVVIAIAVAGTLVYDYLPALYRTGLFEKNRETLVLLCLGVFVALGLGYAWLKPPPLAPIEEGRRLVDALGWAAVLPMMLASLGLVLADTGVGRTIGELVLTVIPRGAVLPAVLAFTLGMALLTVLTGNAFAAFPVMATAIGVPLLVQAYHGNPAVIGAVGMLAGFCGTLLTPMAANFNIVPWALLELKDPNAVIKAQVGTALPLLVVNTALIYFFAF
jgi:uncharacterized membrane protein